MQSFQRVSGESPETLRKLFISKIRWKSGILRLIPSVLQNTPSCLFKKVLDYASMLDFAPGDNCYIWIECILVFNLHSTCIFLCLAFTAELTDFTFKSICCAICVKHCTKMKFSINRRGVHQNGCFKKFRKFHKKIPVLEFLFNKVAGLSTFIEKRLHHSCFPVKFAKVLKTFFFTKYLRWLLLR